MKVNLIYITTESRMEAERIGQTLVEERLAACVNIIDGMQSIYHWEGKLTKDTETILIAKTTAAKTPNLTERVKAIHKYDCPCVMVLPVTGGNDAFLRWVGEEVQ